MSRTHLELLRRNRSTWCPGLLLRNSLCVPTRPRPFRLIRSLRSADLQGQSIFPHPAWNEIPRASEVSPTAFFNPLEIPHESIQ
jgi:hypothetical protein